MRHFPGKKFLIPSYNFFYKLRARRRAARSFSEMDPYIFRLYFRNFGVAAPLSFLWLLDDMCALRKPKYIFEAGGGISTVILAKYAKNHVSSIFSLDESTGWLQETHDKVTRKYPAENIVFVAASGGYKNFMEHAEFPHEIDLVVIDGPAGERFNDFATRFYEKIISPNTICFIDDTDREKNNREAERLARLKSLKKYDFRDGIYSNRHRSSLLLPPHYEETVTRLASWQYAKF